MAFNRWRRAKRTTEDDLFSKIIRYGQAYCWKCRKQRALQAAHIVGRGHQKVRFRLIPVPNAIPLCSSCHDWFDSHKCADILFDARLQKIPQPSNSYFFLVKTCGFSWGQLQALYAAGNNLSRGVKVADYQIKFHLNEVRKKQEAGYDIYHALRRADF